MILALVNGGAHLDYRARDGATPMHRVVARGNRAATKVLLELGASPNYKDSKGLSPVYYAISAEVKREDSAADWCLALRIFMKEFSSKSCFPILIPLLKVYLHNAVI